MRLLLLLTLLMTPARQPTRSLASLVDTNRVLLVIAPSDADPRFQQQLALLRGHAAEMKDRDLVLVANLVHAGPPVDADTLRTLPAPYLVDSDGLATRRRFPVEGGGFAVLLLGKDGDEKLRSATPIPMARLNQTIDAMPMRQEEMKHPR
jgi:hypothetical protein